MRIQLTIYMSKPSASVFRLLFLRFCAHYLGLLTISVYALHRNLELFCFASYKQNMHDTKIIIPSDLSHGRTIGHRCEFEDGMKWHINIRYILRELV